MKNKTDYEYCIELLKNKHGVEATATLSGVNKTYVSVINALIKEGLL
ncbi:hypothetical protein [Vibrio coralliilyticus]|nr:hypothetical protein [Vibrio coralliilyticus]